jgi:pimeloyl-ACP methyl ester carboxylesterase
MDLRKLLRRTGIALGVLVLVLVATLGAFYVAALARERQSAEEAAPPGGRWVSGGDVRIFVQERGPANGSVVLLVHGTGAWSSMWEPTMTALAAQGYRVVALDVPPFGFSERPADGSYDPPSQGRRIAAVMTALDVTNVTLVGHSFQARATVEAAFDAPERVRRLVLVDAALDVHASTEKEGWLLRGALAVRPLREAIVATTLADPLATRALLKSFLANDSAATPERVAMLQRPLVVRGTTHAAGLWLREFLAPEAPSRSNDASSYASLPMPVSLIWGEKDTVTPLATKGAEVQRLLPNATMAVVPRAGHIPQIEEPEAFNAALLSTLG